MSDAPQETIKLIVLSEQRARQKAIESQREFESLIPDIVMMTRRNLKLTQRELASIVGCDYTTVSKIEHGDCVPSMSLLSRIVNVSSKES